MRVLPQELKTTFRHVRANIKGHLMVLPDFANVAGSSYSVETRVNRPLPARYLAR